MNILNFDFDLPDNLIARYPLEQRDASRLLVLDGKTYHHHQFSDLPSLLTEKDLLVFNNTKVFPARLMGKKSTGGKVECLIERVLDEHTALVHLKSSKSPKIGAHLCFEGSLEATVIDRNMPFFVLKFSGETRLYDLLEQYGHIPLPPYMQREDEALDKERYQTVYAKHMGAVAAPTAGLHFNDDLLTVLQEKNIPMCEVTLHVGAGTFQPIRETDITKHHMHTENLQVSEAVCTAVAACQKRGGRVVAVGTTSVRALESAALSGALKPFSGETDIYIYPGYQFKVIDALITNFHLPKSSLMLLVCALAGQDYMMQAYQCAIQAAYRFYSYGDAMFISGNFYAV